MLFQLLSSIGKEVKDLKELVHNNMQSATQDNYHVFSEDTPVMETPMPYVHSQVIQQSQPYMVNESGYSPKSRMPYNHGAIQDVDIETIEETPMSNKELMKKNIIDSLRRNNGNRKKTAKELDISERTLYRKIKDYGLEI